MKTQKYNAEISSYEFPYFLLKIKPNWLSHIFMVSNGYPDDGWSQIHQKTRQGDLDLLCELLNCEGGQMVEYVTS